MQAEREVAGMIHSGTPFDVIEDQIHAIPGLVDDERSGVVALRLVATGADLAAECGGPAAGVGQECVGPVSGGSRSCLRHRMRVRWTLCWRSLPVGGLLTLLGTERYCWLGCG